MAPGIQRHVLLRFVRAVLAFVVVTFALAFAGGPASAEQLGQGAAPTRTPTTAAPVESPAPILPHDMPIVVSAETLVPPVPQGYVTRDLGWLTLSFPPGAEERVASLLRDADSVKADLATALGQPVLDHVEVRIAPTVADMARLAPAAIPPPSYASGVAYSRLRLVLLSMLQPRGGEAVDLDEVFRHELAHVALDDSVRGQHVPVWFNEGLAIWLSGENRFDRESVLWHATLSGTLLPFSDLDRRFPADNFEVGIAYAESADFMRFLMRKTGQARFASMIGRVREGQPFDRAISDSYGGDLRHLEFQWRAEAERRYSVFPILTGGGIVWVVVIGALVLAYAKKRRRAKKILERWGREEAFEDALRAREAALAEDELVNVSVAAMPSVRIEHDGRWHTLH
jgi:hypothetical protein